ncbi:hypothetical protein J3R30DRAFT_3515359 [Lentinula aciculospora]|uniref:DUF6534 domain-containing protein n=1 Tax=Lentinula aciculospora TaxID=153920 RepID=A0A9W9A3M9_9AGAR|nr:hypothetical protein J3R30DRAFT_3515359 [Lentinula aciculospora]
MVQANMDNTLGALFIGLILSAVLNGVTYSQAWFYFSTQSQREKSDPLWLKTTVVVVVVLDLLHQLFTSHWMYDYCVTNFGNSAALDALPWSYYGMAYPTGAVTVIVQSFYVWRVWKLSNNVIIAGAIWSVSLAQLGTFLYYVARVFGVPNASDLSLVLGHYAILVNALGAACDITIACAMVFFLRQSRTSIKRTNHLLRSITIFTVTTGIVSSVCAIMVLSMAGAYPGTNIELTFYFMLTRLYANSFLATLNVRDHLRELSHTTGGIITTSNFVQTRTAAGAAAHRSVFSHEMDDFPRQKGTENFNRSRGELEDVGTVISVKVDRITNADYK